MKLALLNPPKCTGCLFGATTKIPWHGKEFWTAAVHFAPWPNATWNAILLNFACPAITTATNGDYSLQLIVESFSTGATQVAPATIDMLASEGAALCSEEAQPAPTIL